ncbi:hypothetical protein HS088_TW03G00097 [Tripterygium wilfordii]|uniref:Uncharacterized protein n=1 Tax=Tripterygium wilfordii TaxID=458696 RepID=A0A7J7DTS3_TRIWF|nr:uncharacterized protein LOC119992734 [Tripterygium wilfordii]KAF5749772.1 hypothetical protein HS088_TW03G00097 [Tripterygium wilfordii]
MGWSEPEVTCKKHPDLNQLQGVCASCLREKLTHLHVPSQTTTSPSSSLVGSSTSSSGPHHHKRVGSEIVGSMPYDVVSVGNELKKSKSITFMPRNSVGRESKKKGFWSKLLLHSKGNKEDVLMHHSRTTRASLC